MKRFLMFSGGMFLIVTMVGCCYRPAYIDPMTGIPYGGSWDPAPGGPMDPMRYLGDPSYGYGMTYADPMPYTTYQSDPCPPDPCATVPYSSPYSSIPTTVPSSLGTQPILPGCPLWGLFNWTPLGWLFGWGSWNSPYGYGYGYGDVVDPDYYGGEYYETVPPTYIVPEETVKPQPAPPAEEKSEQSNGNPTSFVAPALLPR